MAFESIEKLKTSENRLIKTQKEEIEIRVQAVGVTKVLSAATQTMVKNFEATKDELQISSRAFANVVFQAEDGNILYANQMLEFTSLIQIENQTNLKLIAKELETYVDSIYEQEIVLKCKFEYEVYSLLATDYEAVIPTGNGYEQIKKLSTTNLSSISNENFSLVDEVQLGVQSVLSMKAETVINSVASSMDCIIVEGEVWLNILTKQDANQLKNIFKKMSFTQEISALGARPGMFAIGNITTLNSTCNLSVDDGKTIATISIYANYYGFTYDKKEITILQDAFSIDHEMIVSRQGYQSIQSASTKSLQDALELSVITKDKSVNIDSILGIGDFSFVQASTKVENGVCKLSGDVFATIIYQNADSDIISSTVFVAQLKKDFQVDVNTKSVKAVVFVENVKKRKSKEIELSLQIKLEQTIIETSFEEIVTKIETGSPADVQDSGITIYSAKPQQTYFDIAKIVKVSPELIKTQNPNFVENCDKVQKVVIYRQANESNQMI